MPLVGCAFFHCGHWVRMNFIPGKPQSHTVWSAALPGKGGSSPSPVWARQVGKGAEGQETLGGSPGTRRDPALCRHHPCSSTSFPAWVFILVLALPHPHLPVPMFSVSASASKAQHYRHWALSSLQLASVVQRPEWLLADGLSFGAHTTAIDPLCH
jgi:hypothetical protein